jgi:hypothetical protein
MKLLIVCLLIFSYTTTNAQDSWTTTIYPDTDTVLFDLEKDHSSQLKKYDNKRALKKVYTQRKEYIKYLLNTKSIFYQDSLYGYIDFIFDQIVSSNAELQDLELRYFVSNSPIPNASSLGDGTFIINIGLIRKLVNEGQLAFILCHEISHYYLDHSNQSALAEYEKTNTKEYRKEVKTIQKTDFGKAELSKSFRKKNLYIKMSYSRQNEKEADSLGLIFLYKTNYDMNQSVTCMNLLDSIDRYKYKNEIGYYKTLNFEKYPFKKRWLEEESLIFGKKVEANYWERDSIKSHPDVKTRITFLNNYISRIQPNSNHTSMQDIKRFDRIKEQADYEFIDSWIFYDDYGKALFFAIKQLESDPNNKVLLLKTSYIFKSIYDSQADHLYSSYVERPSLENEAEYNYFLNFLDNIRLIELARISYHFHLTHYESLKNDEEFINNYNFFKTIIRN